METYGNDQRCAIEHTLGQHQDMHAAGLLKLQVAVCCSGSECFLYRRCLDAMETYGEAAAAAFRHTLGWLRQWSIWHTFN